MERSVILKNFQWFQAHHKFWLVDFKKRLCPADDRVILFDFQNIYEFLDETIVQEAVHVLLDGIRVHWKQTLAFQLNFLLFS